MDREFIDAFFSREAFRDYAAAFFWVVAWMLGLALFFCLVAAAWVFAAAWVVVVYTIVRALRDSGAL